MSDILGSVDRTPTLLSNVNLCLAPGRDKPRQSSRASSKTFIQPHLSNCAAHTISPTFFLPLFHCYVIERASLLDVAQDSEVLRKYLMVQLSLSIVEKQSDVGIVRQNQCNGYKNEVIFTRHCNNVTPPLLSLSLLQSTLLLPRALFTIVPCNCCNILSFINVFDSWCIFRCHSCVILTIVAKLSYLKQHRQYRILMLVRVVYRHHE